MKILFRRHDQASTRQTTFRRGVAAVEMAFVLPVFITVIMGMIELCRGIMVAQLLENAAREGARMAILDNSTNAQVIAAAQSFMQSSASINPADLTVTINVAGSNGAALATAHPSDLITVTVLVPFAKVSWLPPNYLTNMNLSAVAAMRHE